MMEALASILNCILILSACIYGLGPGLNEYHEGKITDTRYSINILIPLSTGIVLMLVDALYGHNLYTVVEYMTTLMQ